MLFLTRLPPICSPSRVLPHIASSAHTIPYSASRIYDIINCGRLFLLKYLVSDHSTKPVGKTHF